MLDRTLDLIGLIGVLALVLLPAFYYNGLPEKIPSHFNAKGYPDDYSSKAMLLTIPLIGLLLFLSLTILKQRPYLFNYPTKVTKENAVYIYSIAVNMLGIIGLIITLSFLYIEYQTIQTALGYEKGLGSWFLPSFILSMSGAIIYPLIRMN
ncbi:MAG: DUF1648 domain-containing protein [Flavobacteriaceae bacterium]|nr:DUF1648 domain-containing protein [Flavobacteriaceae bacterium]